MATVHGTFSPNGAVFCDLPECVSYCAEPIWTGEHAGQIALTITDADNEDCNDTFYGCMNFATHKFQVEIPSICCLTGGCSCTNYPDWDSTVTYLTSMRVTEGGSCYISLQDANLNHLPSISPLWWSSILCDCPAGYENVTENHPCTSGGVVPSYICASFGDIKRCYDDTTIPNQKICLAYDAGLSNPDFPDYIHVYTGYAIFEGVAVSVWRADYAGGGPSAFGGLYSGSNVWFVNTGGGDPCDCPNYLNIEDCDDSVYIYEFIWGNRTVKGYDGRMNVCDPNTGVNWPT